MKTNRLHAFLEKAKTETPLPAPVCGREPEINKRTVLVGAHLPPAYNKQLRLIAAEEDVQVNMLVREALDLLFVKKGKARIVD